MANNDNIGFLFDLDGVIIDSEQRYTEIWRDVNLRFPTGVDDFEHRIKGTTLDNILSTYFRKSDWEAVVGMLNEREQAMTYGYLTGAKELLESIRRSQFSAALVTSSNDRKMAHLWEELPDLRHYFKSIIDANQVSRSKPDPEGYLKGAASLAAKTERCVVFEDSAQGVKAGRSAGAYVVGVVGTMPTESLRPYSDILVNGLDEVDFSHLCETLKNR